MAITAWLPNTVAQVGTAPSPPTPALSSDSAATSPSTGESSPRRLTIQVSVADPNDLKVKEGDHVTEGQLVADRSRERLRLTANRKQLELTLTKLKAATITPPLPPAQPPAMAALPQRTYDEQEAAIALTQARVEAAEAAISIKLEEIAYLRSLPSLDPIILEHEQAKLAELKRSHTSNVRDYQLSVGKLKTARDNERVREYQHSLDLAYRVEERNRSALEYQQQLAAYEQRLRDREFQVSQTELKLQEVENAIAQLAVVKSPYSGRVSGT